MRFDAFGADDPAGYTVRNPEAFGVTAVTLRITAPTPVDGTPPRPVTCRVIEALAATGPEPPDSALVSSSRDGDSGMYEPGRPMVKPGPVQPTSNVGADTPSTAFTAPDPSVPLTMSSAV